MKSGNTFSLPEFLDDTATQKVYLCAFVPPTQDVVGTAGSWSEDFEWGMGSQGQWIPLSANQRQTHESLVGWVCEGNPGAWDAARSSTSTACR